MLFFHRSIRAALDTFDELASVAAAGRSDPLKASALYDFFTGPMRWHDVDERESLLKRLARIDASAFGPALEAAIEEHDSVAAVVDDVLAHLHELRRRAAQPDAARLRCAAMKLRNLLEGHLVREERDVFPRARELLTAKDVEEMNNEMVARRLRRLVGTNSAR